MLAEQLDILFCDEAGDCLRCGAQIEKSAFLRFLRPGIVVAVAVKDDALVRTYGLYDQIVKCGFEIVCLFQLIGKLTKRFRNGGIDDGIAVGNGFGGAEHAEFKFISREGEGRGSVSVGGILREFGKNVNADTHEGFFLCAVGGVLIERGEDGGQLVTEEHGDDRGGRFCRTETVVVARGSDGCAEQILIFVDGFDNGAQTKEELRVFVGRFTGVEEIDARIGGHGPVVMLTAARNACKGLFMEQTNHAVLFGKLLHKLHGELVVVGGNIRRGEDGSQLVLCGSGFVVFGFCENAKLPELFVKLLHKSGYAGLDRAEVVVVQFLSLRCAGAEEGSARKNKVGAFVVIFSVNEEVFLLGADRRFDGSHVGIAEELHDTHRLTVKRFHRTEQGSLFIECIACEGAECGRNAENVVLDERVRGGVPGSVTARFKGCAQTAGGEGGRVRLTLYKLFSGKFHDDTSGIVGRNKTVVLFGSDTRHGLEPVCVMRCTALDCPILHGVGNDVGNRDI